MATDPADVERLTERVIGCAMTVHRELGPELLESVYSECLSLELLANQLRVEREREVAIVYRGETIRSRLRIDLLVEDQVIVEVKAVERSNPVYLAQLVTYLKMTGLPAGLLLNF
jgi:GxxExxY protein